LSSTFRDILHSVVELPATRISSLPLVSGLERTIPELGFADPGIGLSVCDAFREQVAANPDRIAVKDAAHELTYSQLDHQARLVSVWLSQRRLAPETMVGVVIPRSVQAIVVYLGVLRANYAYVPLDIKSPAERLKGMLSSISDRPLLLYGPDLAPLALQLTNAECVSVSRLLAEAAEVR
ncbi:acetyl-CoA synthetase-like protein, partial [Teratosphaeria nubilosa]